MKRMTIVAALANSRLGSSLNGPCLRALASVAAAATLAVAAGDAAAALPADYSVQVLVKAPMRDGVRLNATVYTPVEAGPHPVVIMFTPYPDFYDISHFAAHGYVTVLLDERGRGDSDGVFDPLLHDADDGYDAVEWAARQPWSNGKVAMTGGSYAGSTQWLAAAERPPHLVTIMPVSSARAAVDFPIVNDTLPLRVMSWTTLISGKSLRLQSYEDIPMWNGMLSRFFVAKQPSAKLSDMGGGTGGYFQDWLKHPMRDAYWRARDVSDKQVAAISIPVFEIAGQRDNDQTGELSWHESHEAGGRTSYLVIGPWQHTGTRNPKQDVAPSLYGPLLTPEHNGPASVINVDRLEDEWLDHTMKGGPTPSFLQDAFTFYVTGDGADCWKSAPSLKAATRSSLTFHLDAAGGGGSLQQPGVLAASAAGARGGAWTGDPNDLSAGTPSPADHAARLHGDGLVFQTAPLEEAVELDGRLDLRAWLAMDVPDTDLVMDFYVVTPDGEVRTLDQAMMEARHRNSLEREEAVPPGVPQLYRFSTGQFFAARANKGDRLRVVISSLNDPQVMKNWNSMKPLLQQSAADAKVAHIRLLQDAGHPSTLTLPVGDAASACRTVADL